MGMWLPSDSHCLRLYTFISTPQHLPISISLANMSCSTVSSLASTTVKSKGKVHPRTGHEGPEEDQMYSSILSLASALKYSS